MGTVDRFSKMAETTGAEVHTVSKEDAKDVLQELIKPPAVGVQPLTDTVSLPSIVDPPTKQKFIDEAKTGITDAIIGIETLGSVVIPSDGRQTGPVSLFPARQIAIIEASDIVPDIETAFSVLHDQYGQGMDNTVIVTGPSSTGDMGELVTGVHGPGELHIVVICDE